MAVPFKGGLAEQVDRLASAGRTVFVERADKHANNKKCREDFLHKKYGWSSDFSFNLLSS